MKDDAWVHGRRKLVLNTLVWYSDGCFSGGTQPVVEHVNVLYRVVRTEVLTERTNGADDRRKRFCPSNCGFHIAGVEYPVVDSGA